MIVTSSDPKKTVDGFLTNLKSGDFTKAQEFVSENKDILSDEKFDQETEALLFDKMSWKITKITKEDDKANVEIEITNKNFDTIISNCMKKLLGDFKSVLSGSIYRNIFRNSIFNSKLCNLSIETINRKFRQQAKIFNLKKNWMR